MRSARRTQVDRAADQFKAKRVIETPRNVVARIDLEDGPLAPAGGDMVERCLHQALGDAAAPVAGRHGYVGNLPPAACAVGALHGDVTHHAAGIYPDETAEHIVELAAIAVHEAQEAAKVTHDAHFAQRGSTPIVQLSGKGHRDEFGYGTQISADIKGTQPCF